MHDFGAPVALDIAMRDPHRVLGLVIQNANPRCADYGRYANRFEAIARYLREHQPPAMMLWRRHDSFFDCAEILSWLQDLPRMEAHVLDGPHLLLETHAEFCAERIVDFVRSGRLRSVAVETERT